MARLPPPQASQSLVRSDSGVPNGWLRRPDFSSAAAQLCKALRKPDDDTHAVGICNDNRVSGGRAGVVGAQTQCNGVQLTRRRSKADPAPEPRSSGRPFQVVPVGDE